MAALGEGQIRTLGQKEERLCEIFRKEYDQKDSRLQNIMDAARAAARYAHATWP
jgi:hypothetical protein